MTRLKTEIARKRFAKLRRWLDNALSRVDSVGFMKLAWASWALQQKRPPKEAASLIQFPPEAVTTDLASDHAIYPWEWETLLNWQFQVSNTRHDKQTRTDNFGVGYTLSRQLRAMENAESGIYLGPANIFNELHRISHRQFPWQAGFVNTADLYRYLYIYGQGKCAEFFESAYGFSIKDFTKAGFAFVGTFHGRSLVTLPIDSSEIGLSSETMAKVAKHMSISLNETKSRALTVQSKLKAAGLPIAYSPSILRDYPIIAYGEDNSQLRAPLPPLIMLRMTAGIYYDLVAGGGEIRNDIAAHFESYSRKFLEAAMPGFQVEREYKYARKGPKDVIDSPDILISFEENLALIIECKATKLTFQAQFSDDPRRDAEDKYRELAKGVFQLWRFASHCRRGLTKHTLSVNTKAVVLTLDAWLTISRDLQEYVFEKARALAAAELNIEAADQIPIVFAAIQDFERLALETDEAGLLRCLNVAGEERFRGWSLPDLQIRADDVITVSKPYPFELKQIIPWWGDIANRANNI